MVWGTNITFAHYTILFELDDSLTQQPKHVAVLLTNEECYADWNPWLLIISCNQHNVRFLVFMRAILNFRLSRTAHTCTNKSFKCFVIRMFLCSSDPKREVTSAPKALTFYKLIRSHISEDFNLNQYLRKNFKCWNYKAVTIGLLLPIIRFIVV